MSPAAAARAVAWLRERGAAAHVVAGGLAGLLERWERLVRAVEDVYADDLDELLNDLDTRELLDGALVAAAEADMVVDARLAALDRRYRAATEPCACLWGADVAASEGWTPASAWWYFRRPRVPGPALAADLATRRDG
ncbi:MAG: hypothetical protein NW201_03130 [Gemmatimonadales bacterium]|nr:hypothetical protein [Gemmatimonadales bacterium]